MVDDTQIKEQMMIYFKGMGYFSETMKTEVRSVDLTPENKQVFNAFIAVTEYIDGMADIAIGEIIRYMENGIAISKESRYVMLSLMEVDELWTHNIFTDLMNTGVPEFNTPGYIQGKGQLGVIHNNLTNYVRSIPTK